MRSEAKLVSTDLDGRSADGRGWYRGLVEDVRSIGNLVPSAHGDTREFVGLGLTVGAGALVYRQGLVRHLGWMEMLQMIAGVGDLEAIRAVAPRANHLLFSTMPAYGERTGPRVPGIIEHLLEDPYSRRALLYIGNPGESCSPRLQCGVTMQFLLRRPVLYGVLTMRSWDLVKGLPYDLMIFGGLLQVVAACLGASPGELVVNAGSAHCYTSDDDKRPSDKLASFELRPDVDRTELGAWRTWARGLIASAPWPRGSVPEGVRVYEANEAPDPDVEASVVTPFLEV